MWTDAFKLKKASSLTLTLLFLGLLAQLHCLHQLSSISCHGDGSPDWQGFQIHLHH